MRIFTATPKAFLTNGSSDSSFFSRDMGLTCHALQKAGVESRVVLLTGPDVRDHSDVIRASLEQMESAGWWKQFHLDAVVLCAWSAPRYTPIAKAINGSGAKLIVRCDNGEPYSQWQKTVRQSFYTHYLFARYMGKGWGYACGFSLLKTPLFYIPAVYDNRVVEHLSYAGLILNETPDGARFLKELLLKKKRADIAAKVQYVPHPIMDCAGYSEEVKKEKRIVAVGRWDSYAKNAPLLIRTLEKALAKQPDYEAHIFGGGEDQLIRLKRRLPADVQTRIVIRGIVDHDALIPEYQKSRIFFAPSRSESFNIAAAEALACGCSVVGGGHISSFRNFASGESGTVANHYNAASLADALRVEINAWANGLRSPKQNSVLWKQETEASAVADMIINEITRQA